MDHLHHPLRRRHKVRIEDRDKLSTRDVQPLIQRARLIPMPVAAMQIHNRLRLHPGKPARIPLDDLPCHPGRLIGRIIQHLNLKPVARIIQLANRIDQPVDHELLVEDRQLDRHKRQLSFSKPHRRLIPLRRVLLVLEVQPHQLIPMDPIERQDDHHDEVGNQHRRIERIPAVKAVEVIDLVGIVRLPIVANALGSEQQRE